MSNSSIWPIDRTQSGATNPDQSEPGSDGKEEVLCIPINSIIIGATLSDSLVSYPGHTFEESYSSTEMQSVYSTTLADWAVSIMILSSITNNSIKYKFFAYT